MKEPLTWKGRRPSPGEALFIAGFCAGAVLISGGMLLASEPSLGSVLAWFIASAFIARIALAVWRMRTGYQDDGDGS